LSGNNQSKDIKIMKKYALIIIVSILTITGCNSQQNFKFTDDKSVLEFYKQYSEFTDPGEYEYLYENLLDSLPELCSLIRSQFIHPYAELPQYSEQIPEERWVENIKYPTVKSVLEGLLSYDSAGIVNDRKPEDRLVLICRANAILLASILKCSGIPARVRAGYATYIAPGFHINHAICEVWNENDKRWMLVDPSMDMIDFSRDLFDFSNDAWLQMQKKEIDPNLYGNPGKYSGMVSILAIVCTDLAYILGTEYTIYQYAPILEYAFDKEKQLSAEQIATLNLISELMKSLDANNLSKLQDIYNNTPEIQITKSFLNNKTPEGSMDENKASANNQSINKSIIEFVDIPGGTFMMGSPVTEQGRNEDEIQHEVKLSPFKMSKYCVSYEQFDAFCEATGRKKLWGRKRGSLPVTQVTWYDANAFAEWMGCRLPTEAEFEYAARANTTTPFYTGDCLTTDQANFNGKEPYANCEKGINRKKPIIVGSFSPNAFGLYDMHGNMVEWCSDWYGAYNIDEKLNPKGPETGEIKVIRGGGFWYPGWRCRSACRVGDPPGNKGAGLSFRLVKDE
jgi:formylglycine-generating enzyme required for sulfatase activity